MEKTGLIKIVDTWLSRQEKLVDGRPVFRLTWSTTASEVRHGTFNDFSDSGLFIRQITETRETRKYNYVKDRWILERWTPPDRVSSQELPMSFNGTYEPIFVFEGSNGEALPVTLKVVEFIIGHLRKVERPLSGARKSQLKTEDDLALNAEIAEFMQQIG